MNLDFQFTAKLTQVFTHAPDAKKTSSSVETIRYTQKDVDEAKTGFAPLMEADRLGAVIAQFPISFKFKKGGDAEPLHGNWDHVLDVLNDSGAPHRLLFLWAASVWSSSPLLPVLG